MLRSLLTAAFLLAPSFLLADVRSDAAEALSMWQPTDVKFQGGTLTVTLPQRRVTEEIYLSVLTSGICLFHAAGKDFSTISELVVLNQFERQGYVYEQGAKECDTINDFPIGGSGAKFHILGATRLY